MSLRHLKYVGLVSAFLAVDCDGGASADKDASADSGPSLSDAEMDAMTCSGIASCAACRCSPALCLAGNEAEVTTCTPDADRGSPPLTDDCGCQGKTCDGGLTCVRVYHPPPSALGGPGRWKNGCFELCATDAACGADRYCRPNLHGIDVCVAKPSCLSDADCTADLCGHCVPKGEYFHAGQRHLDRSRAECVYEGLCDANSCTECREDFFRGTSELRLHLCGF